MSQTASETSKKKDLLLECQVCKAPAPDHFHFGGKTRTLVQTTSTVILGLQVDLVTRVGLSSVGQFRGSTGKD